METVLDGDVVEKGDAQMNRHPAIVSLIADQAQSGDATSTYFTGKNGSTSPRLDKKGQSWEAPTRQWPYPDRVGTWSRRFRGTQIS